MVYWNQSMKCREFNLLHVTESLLDTSLTCIDEISKPMIYEGQIIQFVLCIE